MKKSKLVFSVTFSYPANMTLETIVETIREKAKKHGSNMCSTLFSCKI